MDSKDHQVTLTSREQQLLADLERATKESDPHLDAWLRTARRSWVRAFSRSWIKWSPARQLAVATVALVAATAVMLLTFTRSLWLAAAAAVIQTAAIGVGVRGLAQLRRPNRSDRP